MEIVKAVVLAMIRTYQTVVSPVLPPACRFHPTCSQYTHEAVAKHGVALGVWLGARRLARCHPFCPGGYDPVPEHPTFFRKASKSNAESLKASSGTLRKPAN